VVVEVETGAAEDLVVGGEEVIAAVEEQEVAHEVSFISHSSMAKSSISICPILCTDLYAGL
jgi:hypothetical protein